MLKIIMILSLLWLLVACGQKGALTVPQKSAPTKEASTNKGSEKGIKATGPAALGY